MSAFQACHLSTWATWGATDVQMLLAVIGALAGIAYAILGVTATRHRKDSATMSEVDRTINWSLWWFIEKDRYDARGQRLCNLGAVAAAICAAAWLFWYISQR
jgi:hypothetical protein